MQATRGTLHDIADRVWCAVSATRIIEHIFSETVNQDRYIGEGLPLFYYVSYVMWKRCAGSSSEDSATVHTANNSMAALRNSLGTE